MSEIKTTLNGSNNQNEIYAKRLQKLGRKICMKNRLKKIKLLSSVERIVSKHKFADLDSPTSPQYVNNNRFHLLLDNKPENNKIILKKALEVWRTWNQQSQNKINIIPVGQNGPDNCSETVSDVNSSTVISDNSMLRANFREDHKMSLSPNSREGFAVDGGLRGLVKRLQEELDQLRQENLELKSSHSTLKLEGSNMFEPLSQRVNENIRENKVQDSIEIKNQVKVKELEKALFEKDALVNELNIRINYINTKNETLEKENERLSYDLKKKENFLQQKLQLEIFVKQLERTNSDLKIDLKKIQKELISVKKASNNSSPSASVVNSDHKEVVIQPKVTKAEPDASNAANIDILEAQKQNIGEKDVKIYKLSRENQISKEINKTMVKLLKLKNVQIQTMTVLNIEHSTNKEAVENLEKFKNEEKKLHKVLDSLMKQYETISYKAS